MHVLAVRIEVHIPQARSLKERRAVLRPIVEGGRHRYRVAIAEVGHQDVWQRAVLGVAAVSDDVRHAESLIDEVERFVWSFPEIEVTETRRRWLDMDE